MTLSHLPRTAALLAVVAAPVLARAHPGHDGDHELVWDFAHLASHPLATLAYVAIAGVAVWGVWRWTKSRTETAAKSRAVSHRRR